MPREWTPADEVLAGINVIARDVGHADCECGCAAYGLPMEPDAVWLRMRGLIEDYARAQVDAATAPLVRAIEDTLLMLEFGTENRQQAIACLNAALKSKQGL